MAQKQRKKQASKKRAAPVPKSRLDVHRPAYERLLFVVALLGVLLAAHLVIWYGASSLPADDPVCGFGFDCEAVIASDPAPLGVPSAVWGLLFYLAVAGACAGIAFLGPERRLLLKQIRVGLIGAGVAYALFLTGYQFFTLSDRCLLCLASASLVLALAVVQALYLRKPVEASAQRVKTGTMARTGALYAGGAALVLVLAGADALYFGSLEKPTAPAAAPAAAATPPPANAEPEAACAFDERFAPVEDYLTLVGDADPVAGNPDASITFIEFFDPNCPHCKTLHPVMQAMLATYGDRVRLVYKPIALPGWDFSIPQVAALLAANQEGKFAPMLDRQFALQQPGGLSLDQLQAIAREIGMDADRMAQRIRGGLYAGPMQQVYDQGTQLGLRGVPAVLFNGRIVASRSRTLACFSRFVDEALRQAPP